MKYLSLLTALIAVLFTVAVLACGAETTAPTETETRMATGMQATPAPTQAEKTPPPTPEPTTTPAPRTPTATATLTLTPEPTPTPTPESAPTATVAPTPTATATPEPTLVPTPEPTPTPTLEPTPALTPEPTPAPTAEPTPTPEPTVEPTPEPTPTATPILQPISAPTEKPTLIPAAPTTYIGNPIDLVLAPLGSNLRWVAHYDIDTGQASVYDPSNVFTVLDLIRLTRNPSLDLSKTDVLTHVVDGESYWVSLSDEASLDGLSELRMACCPDLYEFYYRDFDLRALDYLERIERYHQDIAHVISSFPWYGDGITDGESQTLTVIWDIAQTDADFARDILEFLWFADGVTDNENRTLASIRDIAQADADFARSVLELPWFADGVTDNENRTLVSIRDIVQADADFARSVLEFPWFADGLSEDERRTIDNLGDIAAARLPRIFSMFSLETLSPADVLAVDSLRWIAYYDPRQTFRIIDHPAISDGITDAETKIVATLGRVSENNPGLVDTLLNQEKVTLEERTITLPLAGEVELTIIRTRRGAERTMGLLEESVRLVEDFMSVPFPQKPVIYLFEEAVQLDYLGVNAWTHVAILPEVDKESYSEEDAFGHLVHETAHYYWRDARDWIEEGAANFLTHIAVNSAYGQPIAPEHEPCAYARNIAKLEHLNPTQESRQFICNYSLGERLFHDLYDSLDEADFRQAFSNLYLMIQDPEHDCKNTEELPGICHLRAAFTSGFPAETAAAAKKVINHWYGGS